MQLFSWRSKQGSRAIKALIDILVLLRNAKGKAAGSMKVTEGVALNVEPETGNHGKEVVELKGVVIPLDQQIFSPKIIAALRSGKYEHKEAQALPDIIKEGDRILEIGAGVGYLSVLAGRNPHTAAIRVYEANPLLIPLIKDVHEINNIDSVEVIHGVLSNAATDSKSIFYLRRDFWGSSLLEKPWDYEETIEVDNISFSREIDTFRPTLIICDIEGGELELFRGGHLRGVQRVLMEVHQEVLGREGMKTLFDAMSEKGFHYDQWHSCGNIVLFSRVDDQL